YYRRYGTVADVARELTRPHRERLVVCAQNHDQIGNRAFGDRSRGPRLRTAFACVCFSLGIPLLFMGEELDEDRPFLFFSDHPDPVVARATSEGRRREFAAFTAFHDEIPDPQSPDTFTASVLAPDRGVHDGSHEAYYGAMIALHRRLRGVPITVNVDEP